MERFYYSAAAVLFAVFGLCIGSFLNVVVYRLPRGMNLAKPASHCPSCGHRLAWYDNIPLLSWLLLRGKCRYCGAPVSPRYFIVELANCLLWLACALYFYAAGVWYALACALALSVLLSMALCDMENLFIPDSLQLALLLAAVWALFADGELPYGERLLGIAVGGGCFLFFYCFSFLLFGKEGLGFGDVKLMACAGLLLGWKAVIVSIVFAVAAALADILLRKIARGGRRASGGEAEFAFAPHLALGIAFALFYGNAVAAWYASVLFF